MTQNKAPVGVLNISFAHHSLWWREHAPQELACPCHVWLTPYAALQFEPREIHSDILRPNKPYYRQHTSYLSRKLSPLFTRLFVVYYSKLCLLLAMLDLAV